MKQQSLIRAGLVPALALALASCVSVGNDHHYTVSGTVQDTAANGKTIYILRMDDRVPVDSTTVQDGKFTFLGTADSVMLCQIDLGDTEFGCFVLEPGRITVDLIGHDNPSGTPLNDDLARLSLRADSLPILQQQAAEAYISTVGDRASDPAVSDSLGAVMNSVGYHEGQAVLHHHADDAVGEYLFYTPFFHSIKPLHQRLLIEMAGPTLKQTNVVRRFTAMLSALRDTEPGRPYRDIVGVDRAGQPDSLSRYVGRGAGYTLVDIYATWCGPCKQEQPYLARLHKQFGGKGLTVVGICTWDEEANFRRTLEQKKDTYVHLFDASQSAEATYGIEGVPQILLIGPDGTILHRDLRGDAMVRTVTELMQTK